MAYVRTNIDIVVEKLVEILELTNKESLPISDIKARISKINGIPESTKKKLHKYIENAVINGALVEDKPNRFFVSSLSDVYWKASQISNFIKTGKPGKSLKPKEKTETITLLNSQELKFPLRSNVYYMKNNLFKRGVVVGAIFLDTDKTTDLSYYVKEDDGNIEQFQEELIFESLANLANYYLKEFKQRYPDYGKE